MKHKISLLAIVLSVASCSPDKTYSYVETVKEPSLFGSYYSSKEKDEVIIKAKHDTLAYLEAYQKFVISQKVYNDMKATYGAEHLSIPESFSLTDANGNDISDIFFISRALKEKEIEDRIYGLENNIKKAADDIRAKEKAELIVDSVAVAKLKPFFQIKKDEFDPKAPVWYVPKNAPQYVDMNGIYCYFQTINDIPANFRLRIQYYANDWLFIKKVQFSIDGQPYEHIPYNTEHDNGSGYIWEWCDTQVKDSDIDIVRALANAKEAKMKLIGSQYHKIKTITPQQILDIKRSVELYEALGGKL